MMAHSRSEYSSTVARIGDFLTQAPANEHPYFIASSDHEHFSVFDLPGTPYVLRFVDPAQWHNHDDEGGPAFLEARADWMKDAKGICGVEQIIEFTPPHYMISEKALGKSLVEIAATTPAALGAISTTHCDNLVYTLYDMHQVGLTADPDPHNAFYDHDVGFTLIDYLSRGGDKLSPGMGVLDFVIGFAGSISGEEARPFVRTLAHNVLRQLDAEAWAEPRFQNMLRWPTTKQLIPPGKRYKQYMKAN